ncbi:MAG: hypothetical protein IJ074_08340 [Clostridia bacterium]|nr:hypothetical protein [Clostridia bacterium]
MKMRKFLFRALTVALLVAIGAVMMVIGRGHTMYFDNKKLEYNGETYDALRRINVSVNGEQVAKLSAKDRGMATFTGGSLTFDLEVIREKGAESEFYTYTLGVPYGQDGTVVNLIGLLEELPEEAWKSEFVPVATVEEDDEEIITDEFDLTGEGMGE